LFFRGLFLEESEDLLRPILCAHGPPKLAIEVLAELLEEEREIYQEWSTSRLSPVPW
jgi:hypothetical protein